MKKIELPNYLKDFEFDEAVTHQVHSRVFEILGYLSNIDKNKLSEDEQVYLQRAEDLCKSFIDEIQVIVEYYKAKKPKSSSE